MSTSGPANDGTFATSDHLPEDVRHLYIAKLLKEDLASIIETIWRERDAARVGNKDQASEDSQMHMHPPKPLPLPSEVNNSEHPIDLKTPDAVGYKALEEKHLVLDLPESSPTPVHKCARMMYDNDQEPTQLLSTRGTRYEKRDKQIRPASLQESSSAPTTTAEISFTYLPKVLRVHTQIFEMNQLPLQVRNNLMNRFEIFCTGSRYKKEAYRALNNLVDKCFERPYCACSQIRYNLQHVRHGKPTPPQKFLLGGNLAVSADDKCIKDHVPCVHIIRYEDGYALCFVPLPKPIRTSENFRVLGAHGPQLLRRGGRREENSQYMVSVRMPACRKRTGIAQNLEGQKAIALISDIRVSAKITFCSYACHTIVVHRVFLLSKASWRMLQLQL
ncbi:hypothetical protein DE146DRAFT_735832 [Phaeosphaeria sp. MPI-PUGE-AT-0046c]|nr:hypothetical protein DE146DRAFT_735832 [Phaeosphaeria sp. MPI-PUGE-AT-0046c]